MRKVLVTFVLALTGAMTAYAQQPTSTDQTNTPTNQKVIKDPAEYNAYIAALNTQDPATKAAAMEAFVNQYPQSIVRSEALHQAMAAYQQAGQDAGKQQKPDDAARFTQKAYEVAKNILTTDANELPIMAYVTAIDRGRATGGDAAALKEGCDYAAKGPQVVSSWQKPAEMAATDFDKVRSESTWIFEGTAGFCALQAKDFAKARDHYANAVKTDPTNFQDIYQLAVASLEMNPIDKNGLWYIAKAYALAPAAAKQQVAAYGKGQYRKYHGGYDGWDQFLASVASQSAPPADLGITPAATPQEVACKAVQDNDPATLSFEDWEYVLQFRDAGPACNKAAADKVWQAIQNKQKNSKGEAAKLEIPVKVISADKDTIQAAITDENQKNGKADLKITMEKPLLKPPAPGAAIKIVGTLSDYTPNPFMFIMAQGNLPGAKPPVKKPVRRATGKKKK
jgi:hypothetical protein